jgi:DNA replication and repair protein RecF
LNIKSILLANFRNLSNQQIYPQNGINIICGNNAQGKTNLLEAIWIATGGRSFRRAKDVNLINFEKKTAKIIINFDSKERTQELEINILHDKRKIFLNLVEKTPPSAIVGEFVAVVFSPAHLAIIKDGPNARRNFLNTAICQIKPIYAKILSGYKHILSQRNTLLKTASNSNNFLQTLEVWDQKLLEYGTEIRFERCKYLERLQNIIKKTYQKISKNNENLTFFYKKHDINKELTKKVLEQEFANEIKNGKQEDIIRKSTGKGPHRDDIEIKLNGRQISIFGSQGQQRTAVLARKIWEAKILEELTQEKPVILLDDVMSELDSFHQEFIFEFIKNNQVFITCCELNGLENLKKAKVLCVKNGKFN